MKIPIIKIQVRQENFDLNDEIRALTANRTDVGAVVSFTGICRDENHTLSALEIEHYPGMAQAEILRIAEIACSRWPLGGMVAIHRYGKILPGENIVLVVAASKHRQAAFDGANFLMDFLKTRAPFWKKEFFADGSKGEWVSAKDDDDGALVKWNQPEP
ncbi:MAG: molybdenum cofactor biosynthesis protein MoaE [Hyphomicrobiales bacterium]|nr:molybdenum cofactor biosynthesis protein MoaE [Hyphomicrobiales bacterium]